jgi:hypothetical protein
VTHTVPEQLQQSWSTIENPVEKADIWPLDNMAKKHHATAAVSRLPDATLDS